MDAFRTPGRVRESGNDYESERRDFARPQSRWNRSPRVSEVHGVGGNGRAVRDARRRTEVVRLERALGLGGARSGGGRTELRADQRQPYGFQQAGEPGRGGNAESRGGQDQWAVDGAGILAAYRGHQP